MSPTQRTLQRIRKEGWPLVAVVERWNPHAMIRQDLYGFIDILAVCPRRGILAVQATSGSNVVSRVDKIASHENARPWLETPGCRIEVWGWRKLKVKRGGKAVRWVPRIVEMDLSTLCEKVDDGVGPF